MKNHKEIFKNLFKQQLEIQEDVHALWLGGSSATKREDDLSDLDFLIIAENAENVFISIENFLMDIEGIWQCTSINPYKQKFYIMKNTPETFYLDVVIFEGKNPDSYVEYYNKMRHGIPQVIFDKKDILKKASLVQQPKLLKSLPSDFLNQFEIIHRTFLKEKMRGHFFDSFTFYHRLVQLYVMHLRSLHCPDRYDFGLRYLSSDLPLSEFTFIESMLKVLTLEEMDRNVVLLKERLTRKCL